MISLNNAFAVVNSALKANQAAINVVATNTADAGVAGYTVKIPTLAQADTVQLNGSQAGDGVQMIAAASRRDRVLNGRIDQQTSENASTAARLSVVQDAQTIFSGSLATTGSASGSTDIGEQLTAFFDSFSQLSADPTNASLRQGAVASAQTLVNAFHQASSSLSSQAVSLDQTVVQVAGQVNRLTSEIASLNGQIATIGQQGDGGSLEDQRQADLTQLSQLVGIAQIRTENNGLTVTTSSGALLVSGSSSQPLLTSSSSGVVHLALGETDVTGQLATGGGQLGGLVTARDVDLPGISSRIDMLAFSVANAVNAGNEAGVDATGSAGGPVFGVTSSFAGSAANLTSLLTSGAQVAAAASGAGPTNGSNATAIAALSDASLANNTTASGLYSSLVTDVGSLASQLSAESVAQQASLTQLTSQQSALSSVNLNDQAVSLQNFEQAYQAASKVFTILNTIMAAAINLGTATTVG